MDKILKTVNDIFKEVFNDNNLKIDYSTESNDIEKWDSLNNMHIIVAVERKFSLRVSLKDIQSWNNVGDLCEWIKKHQKSSN